MTNMVQIEKVYQANEEIKEDDVKQMMDWVDRQPHFPKVTEQRTIHFLHSCYYSNEMAKKTLDNYLTIKTHCPEMLGNRNVLSPDVQQTLKTTVYSVLPKATPEGYRILYVKLMDFEPSNYHLYENLKMLDMVYNLWLHQNAELPQGFLILMDMDGVVLGHLGRLGIIGIKKYLYYLQEAMPIRLKGLHFINVVPFMDKILALMKPFMKKELFDVLHIHADSIDSAYKFIPKECLPNEYGGQAGTIKELWQNYKDNVVKNASFFEEEEKLVVDESRRPGKPKSAVELFGAEGTFKKLDID